MAGSIGIQRLEVRGHSNLAISQINGDFDAKDLKMVAYRNAVLKMSARFEGLEFHHVDRENNQAADVLARISTKHDPIPPNIFLERQFKPSVVWEGESGNTSIDPNTPPDSEPSDVIGSSATEITPSAHEIMAIIASWTEPFLAYLNRQELPKDPNEAHCIVRVLRLTRSTKGNSTRKVLPECSKDASLKRKGGSSWLKSMPDWVGTTPRLEH